MHLELMRKTVYKPPVTLQMYVPVQDIKQGIPHEYRLVLNPVKKFLKRMLYHK